MLLVRRGTPATVDEELDPVVGCSSCSLTQGATEVWRELGDTWHVVVEDCRPIGDGTVSRGKRTMPLGVGDVYRCRGRRGRGQPRVVADACGDRHDDDQQADDAVPAKASSIDRSCWFAVGHASSQGSAP